MPFTRYVITLFDPTQEPVDIGRIPDSFTSGYFVDRLMEKWSQSEVHYIPSDDRLNWYIPQLDSGDSDNDFSGTLDFQYKSISFGLAPNNTIAELTFWIVSTVASGNPVYLMKIIDVAVTGVLKITQQTTDEELFEFLKHR